MKKIISLRRNDWGSLREPRRLGRWFVRRQQQIQWAV